MAFVCEFQHTPLQKMIFFSIFRTSCGYEIWGHVPNSLRNKNTERHIPYLLQKMVFWPSKLCCPLWVQGKKTFLSTFKVIILQTVRNECIRFGGHADIEVRYKILRLDVLKETLILHNLSCFE
jgi:hypothetical protein